MKEFEKYLEQKNLTDKTIRCYSKKISSFLIIHPGAENYGYNDIVLFLGELQKRNATASVKSWWLNALKQYYNFLIETGKRDDHPCSSLTIKGIFTRRGVIHADLFTSAELELLMNREEIYAHVKIKNQLIVSFLIYQGMLSHEIAGLKLKHVDLDAGTVYVKGGRVNKSRTLELHKRQMLLIDKYVNESRKRLLKARKGNIPNDSLLLNYRGKSLAVDNVLVVLEGMRNMFPGKNLTTVNVRDSVIANLLNESKLPLEQVQLIAGHRWISSTARLRKKDLKAQQEILKRFHPLG